MLNLRKEGPSGDIGSGSYVTSYGYDTQNRPGAISHAYGTSGSRFAGVTYDTLDEMGNPKVAYEYYDNDNNHNYRLDYGYDASNRLTSWSVDSVTQGTWSYDWVGNWTNAGHSVDAKVDWLNSTPSLSYSHGARGQMTQMGSEGVLRTSPDLFSGLNSANGTATMTWDGAGRRLGYSPMMGSDFEFVNDAAASIPAILKEKEDGSVVETYIREPNGELVARAYPSGGGQYFFFDWLGSSIALAPLAEGTRTDRLYYQPWGQLDTTVRASTLATDANPYRFVGRLGYYTHYQPTDNPMLHDWLQLGVRFYNPDIGRFERRDPIERDPTSAYVYADGMPTSLADPSGEFAFLACMADPACRAGAACLIAAFGTAAWTVINQAGSPQGLNWCKVGVNSLCACMTAAAFAVSGKPSTWLAALLEKFGFPAVFGVLCPPTLNKYYGCDDCDKSSRPQWLYPQVHTP